MDCVLGMGSMKNIVYSAIAAASLVGCTSVPAFDLAADNKSYGSPIVRIASIMANLKCELHQAANDQTEMPQFMNDTSLKLATRGIPTRERRFTLKNIFSAIAYVGEVELTIDATHTNGSNPSLKFPGLGTGTSPLTIGVSAAVSEKGHRSNTTYHSIDFERLVEGPEQPVAQAPTGPCGTGPELRGRLGIEENLKMGLVASSMNDISVWPGNASYPGAPDGGVEAKYTAGRIHAVIDFTTTTSLSGGPTWELRRFIGPNSGEGLFNHKREALNQIAFTFLPLCIRDRYRGTKMRERWEYLPPLPQGTPGWANYLPPCNDKNIRLRKARALNEAHDTNIRSLDNLRLRGF